AGKDQPHSFQRLFNARLSNSRRTRPQKKKTVAEATVKVRNKLHKGYICFVCHSVRLFGTQPEILSAAPNVRKTFAGSFPASSVL
ncbi:MAG: hypothetical protein OEY72_08725, partial [Gammaproteobacteria bacterium]|nr:hypothetical protein [Gammaproteobacteria bacterium]